MLVICKVGVKGAAEAAEVADGSGERGEKALWGFLGPLSAGSGRQRRSGVRGMGGLLAGAAEGGQGGERGEAGRIAGPAKTVLILLGRRFWCGKCSRVSLRSSDDSKDHQEPAKCPGCRRRRRTCVSTDGDRDAGDFFAVEIYSPAGESP
jgi:hypothetical protein